MENTQLSNTKTNKELENELRLLFIKKKEISFNLKRLNKTEFIKKYFKLKFKFY
jgi:hypothetical protein